MNALLAHKVWWYEWETGLLYRHDKLKPVGSLTGNGYLEVTHDYKRYLSHRIIWLMVTGHWPNIIHHINGNKQDNRWSNLYNGDHSINNLCTKAQGTCFDQSVGLWKASIMVDRITKHLGYYHTEGEAHEVYINYKRRVLYGKTKFDIFQE